MVVLYHQSRVAERTFRVAFPQVALDAALVWLEWPVPVGDSIELFPVDVPAFLNVCPPVPLGRELFPVGCPEGDAWWTLAVGKYNELFPFARSVEV